MKVVAYLAISADGFVADENGNIDWMPEPEDIEDKFRFERLVDRISCIAMGSKTFQEIMSYGEWPWPMKATYVFTSRKFPFVHESVQFTPLSPTEVVQYLRDAECEGDMWLLGGADLMEAFGKEKLIDECILTVVPMNLGSGIPLKFSYDDFMLIEECPFSDGSVQMTYIQKKDNMFVVVAEYCEKYKAAVIDLVSTIQHKEFNIALGEQADLSDISKNYDAFYVAIYDSEVVGSVGVKVVNDFAMIKQMFVKDSFRGVQHRVGKKLLHMAENSIKQRGLTGIYLGVPEFCIAAQKFFEKNQYKAVVLAALPNSFPKMDSKTKFYHKLLNK